MKTNLVRPGLKCQRSPASKALSISRAQPNSHALPSRTNMAVPSLSKDNTPARRHPTPLLSPARQPAPDLVPVLPAARVQQFHMVSMKLLQVSRSLEVFFRCCCKAWDVGVSFVSITLDLICHVLIVFFSFTAFYRTKPASHIERFVTRSLGSMGLLCRDE
jgi:hypothetical protein